MEKNVKHMSLNKKIMDGKFKIITKPGCIYCQELKDLLDKHGKKYVEKITSPAVEKAFTSQYEYYPTVPKVIYDKQFLGGLDEVEKLLKKKSIPKKISVKNKS